MQGLGNEIARLGTTNIWRAVDEDEMQSFKSKQFQQYVSLPTASPKKLNKGVRKYYPELSEMIGLEIKQERLQKLQAQNKTLNQIQI